MAFNLTPSFTAAPAYGVASIDRALDLVTALARLGPVTLTALAHDAGCTRTAAFRILQTLRRRGFAFQDSSRGLWRLGAGWDAVGDAAKFQGALAHTAAPYMAALAESCSENVYLHVRDGQEQEVVAVRQGARRLRVYEPVGHRLALHAGAGRLLLAFAPASLQTHVLRSSLPRYTNATRTDAAWIATDLVRLHRRGWLITVGEVDEGAAALTAIVQDFLGHGEAALSIISPLTRRRESQLRSLLPILLETAADLSKALHASCRTV